MNLSKNNGTVMSPRRVLVLAYACEPNLGSEPGVGWGWVRQIARNHETWVITRQTNRKSIEEELAENGEANLNVVYFDYPGWLRSWKRGRRFIRVYYLLWQLGALFLAKRLHRKIRFHLAHHVTFVADWMPSAFSFMGIPFVWGPIGSNDIPLRLFYSQPGHLFYEAARRLVYALSYRNPLLIFTRHRAKKIIVINKRVGDKISGNREKIVVSSAAGISCRDFENETIAKVRSRPESSRPARRGTSSAALKILFAGQLTYIKGAMLALEAYRIFAARSREDSELAIAGDGPYRRRMTGFIKKYGLCGKVKLLGNLPRRELLMVMAASDIFLFPTLEGGSMVVLEAMASGKPVVCLDWGGPGEFVDASCGIKVVVGKKSQIIRDMALALNRLSDEPHLRMALGEAARKRAAAYSWEAKAVMIDSIYREVLKEADD